MKCSKITLGILCIVFAVCLSAQQAYAHATPITYEPATAAVLETAPQKISIRFSERIEPVASSISIFAPDGTKIETSTRLNPRDQHIFEATFPANTTAQGTYTVSWQVVSSDDGHFTKGAFSFSIGEQSISATSGGQIQIQHITTVPQAVTIALELIGQALLIGVLFVLAFILRPLRKSTRWVNTPSIEKKLLALVLLGDLLIFTGIVAFIIIKTFDLQQLQGTSFYQSLNIFLSTVDGKFALYRGVLATFFTGIFLATRKRTFASEKFTSIEWILWILFALMIFDRARVSHAAASHFLPTFSIFTNAVHLFFKEIWVGGTTALALTFLPIYRTSKSLGAHAFSRFSLHLSCVFVIVASTGVYIVWLHLKDPAYLFTTAWGGTFLVLALFAGVFTALRFYHQLVADVTMQKTTNIGKYTSKSIGATLALEALVGIALLFATSAIIITTPPYPPERFAFQKQTSSQGTLVTLSLSPTAPEIDFLVSITNKETGTPIALTKTVITLINSEKSIGPLVAETTSLSPGKVSFPRALFAPPGSWDIHVTGQRTNSYDAIGTFTLNYPSDILASRVDPNERSFGTFETILAAIILATILFCYIVAKQSKKIVSRYASESDETGPPKMISPIAGNSIALCAFVIILIAISIGYSSFLTTHFEKLCRSNGHFWLQSVPVYDGVALSSNTTTGCFLDVGMYHFSDEKSYTDFFKPVQTAAKLDIPENIVAGRPVKFTISLGTSVDGKLPVAADEIGMYHDRILHVIAVDQKFQNFTHIHPEDFEPVSDNSRKTASFTLWHTFPEAGRYALNVTYVVRGREKSDLFVVDVDGTPSVARNSVDVLPDAAQQTQEFDGYKITLDYSKIKAGKRTKLYYHIQKDGKDVRDLEPYLAAAMHVALVKEDLTRFSHTHGEALLPGSVWFQQLLGTYKKYHTHFAPEKFGPTIMTAPWTTVFGTPGKYHVLGEFKHEGNIIVSHFVVDVF